MKLEGKLGGGGGGGVCAEGGALGSGIRLGWG